MSIGRPIPISFQLPTAPILFDRKTCPAPPTVLVNPETVITTVAGSMGDTATAVNGRLATSAGVVAVKVAGMLVALALTHTFGPMLPLEPVTA
jgi:hypothetical protein